MLTLPADKLNHTAPPPSPLVALLLINVQFVMLTAMCDWDHIALFELSLKVQFVMRIFSINTRCIPQLMNVILSMVKFCADMNANTVPSPSQRTVVFEDPVIAMLPSLEMLQGRPEDMRYSPSSNTTVVLDLSGPLHR